MSSQAAVVMEGISKQFGAVKALDAVCFSARRGCIQALVGENGAGKTTLMKVLYGEHKPDAGNILIDGKPAAFRSAAEAIKAGVGMVSQHYAIIPELTCLENLILGAEPGGFIDLSKTAELAEKLAGEMGFRFDWTAPAARLSPGEAQKLEILKLLWRKAEIMILDEPTAMLSPSDADSLYESLGRLAKEGKCVIVVTHRLPEVLDHCVEATVLRGGRLVKAAAVADSTQQSLAELIVGHGIEPPRLEPPVLGEPVVRIHGATVKGDRGDDAVKEASLELRAGEVVGIAGVDGSGQKELFDCLLGLRRAAQGRVEVLGLPQSSSPRERLSRGLRVIPEDRLSQAVIPSWSLTLNAALGLQREPEMASGALVSQEGRRSRAEAFARVFSTRHGGLDQPIASLSGGNQQRFVAGRALGLNPRLILAFQPARGLDIDGSAQVYEAMRERCRSQGAAILVVSFDLDELLAQCDRIVVMCAGVLTEPPPERARDRAAIGRLMTGGDA